MSSSSSFQQSETDGGDMSTHHYSDSVLHWPAVTSLPTGLTFLFQIPSDSLPKCGKYAKCLCIYSDLISTHWPHVNTSNVSMVGWMHVLCLTCCVLPCSCRWEGTGVSVPCFLQGQEQGTAEGAPCWGTIPRWGSASIGRIPTTGGSGEGRTARGEHSAPDAPLERKKVHTTKSKTAPEPWLHQFSHSLHWGLLQPSGCTVITGICLSVCLSQR